MTSTQAILAAEVAEARPKSRSSARRPPSSRRRRRPDHGTSLSGAARYRKWWTPYLWMAAPVLIVGYFYVFPFFNTIWLSLTDARPLSASGAFVGLENYIEVLSDERFWNATLNSVVYALIVVPFMTVLPLLLAVLVRDRIPGIGVFRSLYYIPAVSSLVVVSLAWTAILKDDGAINNILVGSGLIDEPISFLTDRWLLIVSATLITLWQGLPYYMIMYLAALANLDRSLYEAAALDGAGPVRTFLSVTVPGVRVMMALVATLSMIGSLKIFTEVHLLSGGTGGIGRRSETLTMYIRSIGMDPSYGSLGGGSAAAVCLFILTMGLIVLQRRLERNKES